MPECLLVEPTETESKETLDGFVEAMAAILEEAGRDIDTIKASPHNLPNRRFNEVAAAKALDVVYQEPRDDEGEPAPRTGTSG